MEQRKASETLKTICSTIYSNTLSRNINLKTYRTIIYPVVLYGCVTWSLRLTEKLRSVVSANMVLMRIFESRRDEVKWEWRKLHTEEFNDVDCSPSGDPTQKNEIGEACNTYGGEERCIQSFGGET